MKNFLKIKCTKCFDILTDGELRVHDFKPQGSPVICYQCSQLAVEEAKKKYQEKKALEKSEADYIPGYDDGETPKGEII